MRIFYNTNFKFISGLLLLFMLLGVKKSWGQTTVIYSGMGTIVCPASPTATISPIVSGLTFSQISRGSGVTCASNSIGINGSGFSSTSQANAITNNQFYSFSVTSDASTLFSVTGISIQSQRSNSTSTTTVDVQYSINGGSYTTLYSYAPTTSAAAYSNTPASPLTISNSQSIVFRLVIYNADGNSSRTTRVENNTSITVVSQCASITSFYSKSSGDLNTLSTWGTNTDGTGTAPSNFTSPCQIFNIRNGNPGNLSAAWAVSGSGSKIVVEQTDFTISSTNAVTGTIDVNVGRTLTQQNATLPTLGILNATSTVIYNQGGSFIPTAQTFGNVILDNTFFNNPGASVDWTLAGSMTLRNGATCNAANLGINTTGTLNQTLSGGNFVIRSFDHTLKTNGNLTLGVNSNITIGSGSFTGTFTGTSNQFVDGGNTITIGNNATMGGSAAGYNLTGTIVLNASSGTANVRGDGASNLPIAAQLNNVIANVSGTTNTHFRPTTGNNIIVIKGNLSITGASSGTVIFNANTVSIGGSFFYDRTVDNITAGTSNIVFYGTNAFYNTSVTAGNTFYNISIPGSSSLTLNGNINAGTAGVFSVAGTLNAQNNVVAGAGSFTLLSGSTLITSNTNGVTGSSASSGSIQMSQSSNETYNDGANYIFNGTAAQSTGFIGNGSSISNPQIANAGNIHIANTSAAVTQDGDLQGTSGLTATLSIPGNAIYVLPATVNINKGTGGIVSVAGTIRTGDANGFSNTSTANLQGFSGTSDIVLGTNSVVEYNGGTQVVTNQIPYQNVLFSSSSTKTPAGNTSVIGNVSLTGSGPLNLGSNTFSFGGNWYSTSQSNLSEQSSIVNWNGTGTQNITVIGGVENFYLLSICGTGTLNLNNNVSVGTSSNGGLSIASGTLDAGTNSLSASASNLLTISGGLLRLAKTGVTLPEITGANNLSGGTIELYGNGNQALSGTPTYNNLIFSNNANTTITSGITLVTAAGVLIKDNAILNVDNRSFGGTTNTLTMTGSSKFINAGSGVKPDLGGNYALGSGTTIEFSGTSNTTLRLTPVYQNIIISGSAGDRALPSAASTLQVQGNFTNYYTGLSNGFVSNGGTVRLNGTNQTIGGIKNTEFATLVVENNGTKTITNAGVSIRNVLSFAGTSTSINNAGSSVILLSSATNTARLAQVPTGCSYIGNMTMQRYMAGSGSKQLVNYQLASPVSGAPVSHWQPTNTAPSVPTNGFYISGNFIGKDVPTLTGISAGSLASLLTYNSTTGGFSQFPIATNTENLSVGIGYRGLIRDGTTALGFTSVAGKTLALTGNPTIGDFAFTLFYDTANTLTSWNFIGNPYPSEIDGDLSVTLDYPINTNLNNAVYVFNSTAVGYNTYINGMGTASGGGSWDGKIPSSQGFWVKSNDINPALTISENAKTVGSTMLLRTEPPVYYRIKLQNNNGLDETLIAISDNATYNFDGKFDAEKLNAPISNGQPNLRTESKNGTKLTINTIPSDKIQPFDTVWISYNSGLKNNHTFDFYSFETFDANIDVFLIDKFSDSISNMKTQKEYTFANTTFSGKRFAVVHKTQLRVETPTNQNNTTETTNVNFQNLELHFDIIPNPFENQTFEIKTNSSILESQLKISNLLGQNIPFEIKNNGNNNYKIILLENRKGIYFIHIQTEKFASIKKVIAK